MALLGADYASSDEEASNTPQPSTISVVPAPEVSTDDPMRLQMMLAKPTDTTLSYNVSYSDLSSEEQGPKNPFKSTAGNALKRKNVLTGHAQETVISEATFSKNLRTFSSLGFAADPGANGAYVGDLASAQKHGGKDIVQIGYSKSQSKELRRKRQRVGDASIVDGEGSYKGPFRGWSGDDGAFEDAAASSGDELASGEEWLEDPSQGQAPLGPRDGDAEPFATDYQDTAAAASVDYHESERYDYLGRTILHVPQDLDVDLKKEPGAQTNYIPKKLIHTWKAGSKAVNQLRYYPRSGHLIAAASADGKVRLYDAYHSRSILRTYSGDAKSVGDIDFSPSGTSFLSASFSRNIRLWDTESGKSISTFSTGKIPHCVRFNPFPEHSHSFVAGMSDNKIVQFDTRSRDRTQEYDHHLGPVNTIVFTPNNQIVSTSDDRSIKVWEWDIGVPIKNLSDPSLFSLVRGCLHSNQRCIVYQSADNRISILDIGSKIRLSHKREFRGHNSAGFAIDVQSSPDGQFVMSGDSGGYLVWYDWKRRNMLHKIKASDSAVISCQWAPQETSKCVSGDLEGRIKLWD